MKLASTERVCCAYTGGLVRYTSKIIKFGFAGCIFRAFVNLL